MTTPVDQQTFAELVSSFQALIAQQEVATNTIAVISISGSATVAINPALHGGKRLRITNGATVTVSLPFDAPVGTIILPRQTGIGALKFVPSGAATLVNKSAHNGTSGQWAGVCLTVEANTNGTSAQWVLEGDTAVIA